MNYLMPIQENAQLSMGCGPSCSCATCNSGALGAAPSASNVSPILSRNEVIRFLLIGMVTTIAGIAVKHVYDKYLGNKTSKDDNLYT